MMARGSSMFPFVPGGSRLSLSPRAERTICVGDIVCYPGQAQQVVAHRVREILPGPDGPCYRICGDGSSRSEVVPVEAIAWVVTRVEHRYFRYDTDSAIARLLSSAALDIVAS